MSYSRIDLDNGADDHEYVLRHFNAQGNLVFVKQAKLVPCDNHFILIECGGSCEPASDVYNSTISHFGVAHDLKEAEKRLHDRLKELGEERARNEGISLEDLTKSAMAIPPQNPQ